jgi:preprotein translocase subunit SecY
VIEVLKNLQNVTKIPELKRRLLVTAGLLAAYRLGAHVPTPGVDAEALARFFDSVQGTLLGLVDLFSGGNLRSLTVFALGIMPYIHPGAEQGLGVPADHDDHPHLGDCAHHVAR